jgi:hypothetical protein
MSENSKKLEVKKAQDEKFDWINRVAGKKNYHRAYSDISINCITYNKTPFAGLSFTFRNDVWGLFGECVEIAIYKNRILFRTAPAGQGMKLSRGSEKSPNKYFKMKVDGSTQEIKDKFIGDYELKYDSFYELYYIEREDMRV